MKNKIIKAGIMVAVFAGVLLPVGCKKDYTDPNRATDEQVFSSPKGLTGVVTGLQRVYTLGRASNLRSTETIRNVSAAGGRYAEGET